MKWPYRGRLTLLPPNRALPLPPASPALSTWTSINGNLFVRSRLMSPMRERSSSSPSTTGPYAGAHPACQNCKKKKKKASRPRWPGHPGSPLGCPALIK
jgi:hypothetical protein